ncbi:MAG: hypothetical protein AAB462_02615 [Patescibacteria group bacterium]
MDDPEHYFYRYRNLDSVPDHPIDGTFATIVPVEGIGYLAIATDAEGRWAGAGAAKTPAGALIDLTVDKLALEKPRKVEPIPVDFASLDEPRRESSIPVNFSNLDEVVEDFGNPAELELDDGDVPEYDPDDPSGGV